jgi:Inner membrane protein YgaP-like, transmembrane domain
MGGNMKRKIHDGIVGALVAGGVALGYWGAPEWLLVPGIVGVLLIQSAFTGFCPVYYTLDRLHVGEGEDAGPVAHGV